MNLHRFAPALTILALAAASPADTLKVVPPSAVEFSITNRRNVRYAGQFKKAGGSVDVSGDLAKVKLTLDLRCDTLTTDTDKVTALLKSADYFDAARHPTATLTTTGARSIRDDSGHTHLLTADVTIRGVTKALTIPVSTRRTETGVKLTGKVTVNRKEFGMTGGELGDEIAVTLTIFAGK